MKQFKIITPTTSISNMTSKFNFDTKKEKSSTCAGSAIETLKKRSQLLGANLSPTLAKLQNLRSRTTTNSVSPEQAALVVKDYILPLFRLEKQSKHLKRRSEVYGTKTKFEDGKEGGILSDFKLSDRLNTELMKLKQENKTILRQLNDAQQEKEIVGIDCKTLKNKLLIAEGNLVFLNFAHTQTNKANNQEKFGMSLIKEQYFKYKNLYEEETAKRKNLGKMLEEEKAKNDRIKTISIQLEYVNTLLVMENDIIGEKLKGLYIALNHLCGPHSIHSKTKEEYRVFIENLKSLISSFVTNESQISEILEEKKELEMILKELSEANLGIKKKKEKYIQFIKEKYNLLKLEFKNIKTSQEKQKHDYEDLQKRYNDLQAEYFKIITKVKTYKNSFSSDLLEERLCKNCQKTFVEKENYNWSCKRHSSLYTEGIF